jgi:hypothetical protein
MHISNCENLESKRALLRVYALPKSNLKALLSNVLVKGRALARPSERSERFEPIVRRSDVRII